MCGSFSFNVAAGYVDLSNTSGNVITQRDTRLRFKVWGLDNIKQSLMVSRGYTLLRQHSGSHYLGTIMGPLMGGPQCRISNLRNCNVAYRI